MARIIAEVLDGSCGQAADAVQIRIARADGGNWIPLARTQASALGRVDEWDCERFGRGLYRISVESDGYFAGLGLSAAYPEVDVVFRVRDHHDLCRIQVVLSPYSYSAHISAT